MCPLGPFSLDWSYVAIGPVIFRAPHDSKKRMSNTLCATHELLSLLVCCMQVNSHPLLEKDQGIPYGANV